MLGEGGSCCAMEMLATELSSNFAVILFLISDSIVRDSYVVFKPLRLGAERWVRYSCAAKRARILGVKWIRVICLPRLSVSLIGQLGRQNSLS